jgi:release factor glutamine methyltransferase
MNVRRESALEEAGGGTAALLAGAVAALSVRSATAQLDAELLLAFVTARSRSSLRAFPERAIAATEAQRFAALVARRATGEPLAYLTGAREFFSLELGVAPDVLVPRPETELLVETVLALTALQRRAPAVLDLGTGSGAIALALKQSRRDAVVTAVDSSAAALAVARGNGVRLGLDVRWLESDWFAALGSERFDIVASNPPYVRSADVAGDLVHEPRQALDGGADGLGAYRAILGAAPAHLAAGGAVVLEHGYDQRAVLAALAVQLGFAVQAAHDDLAGRARVLVLARSAAHE